jgi:pimeloyl-ACP methyl ester carboxylesterase
MNNTLSPMSQHYFLSTTTDEPHRIAYTHWGEPANPKVLICVHGLTRNSRDFDNLAATLASHYRVICPDMPGRGQSDWLSHPEHYTAEVYLADMLALLEHLNLKQVGWLGTSMGGLIGITLAAQQPSLIQCLILNDIGPFIPKEGLVPLVQRLTQAPPQFTTLAEAEQFLRLAHSQFGSLTDSQWQQLTQHSTKLNEDGYYYLVYDPQIAYNFKTAADSDMDWWSIWQMVHCPVMLLHGEQSAILLPETIAKMQTIHSQMKVVTFPGIGHAPALMAAEQINTIQEWLLSVS